MRYTCVAEGEEDKRHESYGNELLEIPACFTTHEMREQHHKRRS